MASSSRPGSPATGATTGGPGTPQRPLSSAMMRPPRSNSRMSVSSGKQTGSGTGAGNTGGAGGSGSRASDEDAKTAVKVAVRVRPPLKPDDPGYDLIPQRFQRPVAHSTSQTSLAVDTPHGRKLFVFDRVFSESVDQEGVWDYLHDSVASFMQGYNVSLLAYGQSGAGKSYTMGTSGPKEQNDPVAMGIVPRAAQLLFDRLTGGQSHNRSGSTGLRTPTRYSVSSSSSSQQQNFGRALLDKNWQLKATYVEIYNEQLRDLLLPESTPAHERSPVTIREDTKGRIILTGLQQVNINSFEDLLAALNFGSSIRQTDATAINAKSSRSHAVFSLNLIQRKEPSSGPTSGREKRFSMPIESLSGSDGTTVTTDSKLHFVDLAGSERLKNTGAYGDRAKEGISINAGLASLGKVISQLSSRQGGAHVSYRDSKLTRLLQDSLGGNAYTYMIACITPVEFHINETLNTAQYAQRARAIQSKPQIQQSMDEGDKQAVIDRLRAEISFLRQQLRNTEERADGERRGGNALTAEGGEKRQSEREMELQNQLLDVQEGYTALSQRHAKLISELTKATDFNGEPEDLNNIISDNAMERLKRSHSFAESVEQVVLEYEKTIQSLESSLSDTRSSLASTESNLLERETKCAYVETLNTQLQARIQKMMDRESNTDTYLHELESKLDGHSSGEEQHAAVVAELRKEIVRVRENEASCEDYISTLEERLAEADQDTELMQREVDRLEHVIDRQRSLGKLDNLLYELDHIQQNGTSKTQENHETGDHHAASSTQPSIRELKKQRSARNRSLDVLMEAAETAIPESDDDLAEPPPPDANHEHPPGDEVTDDAGLEVLEKAAAATSQRSSEPSTAAAKTTEEKEDEVDRPSTSAGRKLEKVTQELTDLRVEHENTVNDYSILNTKYEEALRSLAELQDAVDEARHRPESSVTTPVSSSRPVSFLGGGGSRVQELKSGGQHQSSRSLSSELSSAEELPFSPTTSESTQKTSSALPDAADNSKDEATTSNRELETMRKLLQEHQQGMDAVTQQYAQLQSEHEGTLSLVENLKKEVEKSKVANNNTATTPAATTATSPTSASVPPSEPSPTQKVIRRMTSQNMTSVDRAHRSLASLRNIASEEFESQSDTMQNFEMHLNAAMHELHTRMERIQSLEAENQNVKKEMETKTTIISGLTRERSSLQGSSAIDMSVVSQLRDQIVNYETQMREQQQSHDAKETELKNELAGFNDILDEYKATVQARDDEIEQQKQTIHSLEGEKKQWEEKHSDTVASLQSTQEKLQSTLKDLETASSERGEWQSKHETVTESLQSSEKQLQSTLAELNATLASLDALRSNEKSKDREQDDDSGTSTNDQIAAANETLKNERAKHQTLVDSLKQEIESQKTIISTHESSISDLEKMCEEAKAQSSSASDGARAQQDELASYTSRVAQLTDELEAQKSTVEMQKSELSSLQAAHEEALKATEARMAASGDEQLESRLAEKDAEHKQAVNDLRTEVANSKQELTQLLETITGLLNAPVTVHNIHDQLQDVLAQKQHFSGKYAELMDTNDSLLKQLDVKQESHDKLEKQVGESSEKAAQHEVQINELARLVADHEETLKAKDDLVKKKEAMVTEITAEKDKNVRLVGELEDQITNSFDQHNNRLSVIQQERNQALEDAKGKIAQYEKDIEGYRTRIDHLEGNMRPSSPAEGQPASGDRQSAERTSSMNSNLRKSASATSLPSPPPSVPLPPLPNIAATTNAPNTSGSISPPGSRHASKELANTQVVEDQEARIRTVEKHLHAEKQLTATLEEALGDLEAQSNKVKTDMESWKNKAWQLEEELNTLQSERKSARQSVQQVEEERNARREAEAARAHLEEKMNVMNKKKKKSTLNCF